MRYTTVLPCASEQHGSTLKQVIVHGNPFPPNDTILWCHHGHGLSTSQWELIWGVTTLVHDLCFILLFLMGIELTVETHI